jgi:MAPEG family
MSAFGEWLRARARTLRLIGVGTLTWPLAVAALWKLWPEMAPLSTREARLELALELCVAPAALLFLMVAACFRLFDKPGVENPFAGLESERFKINARVLSNTLEQTALFVPVFVALSLRIAPLHTRALPALMALWCLSRVLFWIGIHIDLAWRALGFDWTFYTAALALGWFVATLL